MRGQQQLQRKHICHARHCQAYMGFISFISGCVFGTWRRLFATGSPAAGTASSPHIGSFGNACDVQQLLVSPCHLSPACTHSCVVYS